MSSELCRLATSFFRGTVVPEIPLQALFLCGHLQPCDHYATVASGGLEDD
jgi:hypothetical protein